MGLGYVQWQGRRHACVRATARACRFPAERSRPAKGKSVPSTSVTIALRDVARLVARQTPAVAKINDIGTPLAGWSQLLIQPGSRTATATVM